MKEKDELELKSFKAIIDALADLPKDDRVRIVAGVIILAGIDQDILNLIKIHSAPRS